MERLLYTWPDTMQLPQNAILVVILLLLFIFFILSPRGERQGLWVNKNVNGSVEFSILI